MWIFLLFLFTSNSWGQTIAPTDAIQTIRKDADTVTVLYQKDISDQEIDDKILRFKYIIQRNLDENQKYADQITALQAQKDTKVNQEQPVIP